MTAAAVERADKVFFPEAGLTKGDLADYYLRVADTMLPHLEGRPVTLHRFPDGLDGQGFFQKDAPSYFPDWIPRSEQPSGRGPVRYTLCDRPEVLTYLVDQGVVTLHVWTSRDAHPDRPDRLVFDLDPPEGGDFDEVRFAALQLRAALEKRSLSPFLMTTGSKGLHVVAPLEPKASFDEVRAVAKAMAEAQAEAHPERLTVAQRKAQRGRRVFLDYLRNARGQTVVAPYSVRAKPGAPIATPVDWAELEAGKVAPQAHTLENIFRRLGQKADPWAGIDRARGAL